MIGKEKILTLLLSLTIPLNVAASSHSSKITSEELENYLEKLSKITPNYHHEINFYVNQRLISLPSNEQGLCSYEIESDKQKEVDKTVKQIMLNTEELLEKYPGYFMQPTPEMIEILRNYLTQVLTYTTSDLDEDFCKLQDISITIGTSNNSDLLGGYDTIEDNVTIYYDNVLNYCKETLSTTIYHELNHVRQMPCEHETNNSQTIPKILLESSAESSLYNEKIDEEYLEKATSDYQYASLRRKETFILLLGLMRDEVTLEDYYNAIYDNNLEKLYLFCGANTMEEKRNIEKIWVVMASEPTNSLYKIDILKIVLKNMMNYTYHHPELSLEENLAVLNIVKNLFAATYQTKENIDKVYIHQLVELITIYQDFLCTYYYTNSENIEGLGRLNSYVLECLMIAKRDPIVLTDTPKAADLLEKYPILKAILYPNYLSDYDYQQLTLLRT